MVMRRRSMLCKVNKNQAAIDWNYGGSTRAQHRLAYRLNCDATNFRVFLSAFVCFFTRFPRHCMAGAYFVTSLCYTHLRGTSEECGLLTGFRLANILWSLVP